MAEVGAVVSFGYVRWMQGFCDWVEGVKEY